MKKNKKNKKNEEKVYNSISKLMDDINENLANLLLEESIIETKKKANIKLTNKEIIFDNYLMKPSFMIRHLKNLNKIDNGGKK